MPPATLPAITPVLEEDGDEVEVEVVDPEEVDCPEVVEPALVDVDDEVLLPINVPGSISGIPKKIHGVRRFVRWGVCSRTTDVERLSIIPVVLRLRKGVIVI